MNTIQITFGPDQQYVLNIPVTEDTRAQLLKQFQAVAAKLAVKPEKKQYCKDQQVFSFCN
jgi:hypothetical protein